MKKTVAILLAVMLVASACIGLTGCDSKKSQYTVGICQIQPHAALDAATQGFKDALVEALGAENVKFVEQNAQGDSTACTTIINDFVNKNVDLILANATPVLQAAAISEIW